MRFAILNVASGGANQFAYVVLIDPEYSEICEIVAGLRPGPPAAEAWKDSIGTVNYIDWHRQ